MKRLALLSLLALGLSGCAAAAVVALVDADKGDKAKKQFTERFEVTNAARQREGLPPLDLCSEMYWFDKGWSRKSKKCVPRINRYENGDSTALNPPGMVLATTVPTVNDSLQRIYDERAKRKAEDAWMHEPSW